MVERNHEYLASGLRQQMESLSHMIDEVEHKALNADALEWRLRAIELGIRRLREAA